MMKNLKRCPFCGNKAVPDIGQVHNQINCKDSRNCAATVGPFDTEEETISAWNRRAIHRHIQHIGLLGIIGFALVGFYVVLKNCFHKI